MDFIAIARFEQSLEMVNKASMVTQNKHLRIASYPHLKTIMSNTKDLISLDKPEMPEIECRDSEQRSDFKQLEIKINDGLGSGPIRHFWRSVIIIEIVPQFYWKGQTSFYRTDLTPNELAILWLIMQEGERLPVSVAEIRKRTANPREWGEFCYPIGIIQLLAKVVDFGCEWLRVPLGIAGSKVPSKLCRQP